MSGFHHPVQELRRPPRSRGACGPAPSRDVERCLSPVRSLERWQTEADASIRRSRARRDSISAGAHVPLAGARATFLVLGLAAALELLGHPF